MKKKKNIHTKAPVIILVRPQLSQNIGMVARAMMNCGLCELRVISPKEPVITPESIATASGADAILNETKVFDSLASALKDIRFSFATTARVRDMVKVVYTPIKAGEKLNTFLNKKAKVAYIFGPERTGLENEDIVLADALVRIPLNPEHPSLNLAQAVLLIGWSWWQLSQQEEVKLERNVLPAPKEEEMVFLNFLTEKLKKNNYFCWPEKEKRMYQNLTNIFLKAELTSSEIKTLYRVVKFLSD